MADSRERLKESTEGRGGSDPDRSGGFNEYRAMIMSNLERQEKKLDAIQGEVQEVNISQARTTTVLASIEAKVQAISESVDKKNVELTTKLASHDTRIGALETTIGQAKIYGGLGSRVASYLATIIIAVLTAGIVAALGFKR